MPMIMRFISTVEGESRPEFVVTQDENGYVVDAVSHSSNVTSRRLRHLGQVLELVGNWMGNNDYQLGKTDERREKKEDNRSTGKAKRSSNRAANRQR